VPSAKCAVALLPSTAMCSTPSVASVNFMEASRIRHIVSRAHSTHTRSAYTVAAEASMYNVTVLKLDAMASSLALLGGCSLHGHMLVCAPVLVMPSVRLAGLLDGRVNQLAAPRAPWTVDDLPDAFLVSKSVAGLEKYR